MTNTLTNVIIYSFEHRLGIENKTERREVMKLPRGVEFIISRLNEAGHRADIVGGCVRDVLLGKEPNDYDITTDAAPDKMREIFSDVRTVDTGIKHGTLTVIIDSVPYEVTAYRLEGVYSDNRHPDSVSFTKILSDDLARRDFTVNAMCYNAKDGYTDLFFGKRDLERRIIRAVGDPVKRFSEDALRILRALRFASTLDFDIEENTAKAIFETKELLLKVSAERIFTEWKKLIAGAGAYRIIKEYAPVISLIIPEFSRLRLPDEDRFLAAEPKIRELSLFALSCERPAEAYITAMQRLRSDNRRKNFGVSVLDSLSLPTSKKNEQHILLVGCGWECAAGVMKLKILLGLSSEGELASLTDIINSGACYRIRDMRINGDDLKALGFVGADIGNTLGALLYKIAKGEVKNEREELVDFVKKNLTQER